MKILNSKVKKWITEYSRLITKTLIITASTLLLEYYPFFSYLYIDEITRLIIIKKQLLKNIDKLLQYTEAKISSRNSLSCLPQTLFPSAFDKIHEGYQAGLHVAQYKFHQQNHTQFLRKRLSYFIHDCIDCQRHSYNNMKKNKTPTLQFSKRSIVFIRSLSLDTEGPLNFSSEGDHHVHVIVQQLSKYIVTAPTPKETLLPGKCISSPLDIKISSS